MKNNANLWDGGVLNMELNMDLYEPMRVASRGVGGESRSGSFE